MNFKISSYSLPTMRKIAGASLLLCVLGLFASRLFESHWSGLAWFAAFFEAAMVGGLADWFAVEALFRHPFGLPIPHTAILPNNKARVAQSLAHFLETSFLTEERISPIVQKIDIASAASSWLKANARSLSQRAVLFAPEILSSLSDQEMTALFSSRAKEMLCNAEVGPAVGAGLEVILQNGRDREIFTSATQNIRQLIQENRPFLEEKVRKEIPLSAEMLGGILPAKDFVGPLLDKLRDKLVELIADKILRGVQSSLDEAVSDPNHKIWKTCDEQLRQFIENIKHSPEMKTKIAAIQKTISESHVVEDFAEKVWKETKQFLLNDCAKNDSLVCQKLENAILSFANQLSENPALRDNINDFLRKQIVKSIPSLRPTVRKLVIETMEKWEAKEMSDRLEETVGRDLQFIRLNGTLVGGLIGVIIYTSFWLIGK